MICRLSYCQQLTLIQCVCHQTRNQYLPSFMASTKSKTPDALTHHVNRQGVSFLLSNPSALNNYPTSTCMVRAQGVRRERCKRLESRFPRKTKRKKHAPIMLVDSDTSASHRYRRPVGYSRTNHMAAFPTESRRCWTSGARV